MWRNSVVVRGIINNTNSKVKSRKVEPTHAERGYLWCVCVAFTRVLKSAKVTPELPPPRPLPASVGARRGTWKRGTRAISCVCGDVKLSKNVVGIENLFLYDKQFSSSARWTMHLIRLYAGSLAGVTLARSSPRHTTTHVQVLYVWWYECTCVCEHEQQDGKLQQQCECRHAVLQSMSECDILCVRRLSAFRWFGLHLQFVGLLQNWVFIRKEDTVKTKRVNRTMRGRGERPLTRAPARTQTRLRETLQIPCWCLTSRPPFLVDPADAPDN